MVISKASFYKRVLAYFIDMVIVGFIALLISPIFPMQQNLDALNTEYINLSESYKNGDISLNEYISHVSVVIYDIDYSSVFSYISETIILILYFVVFQFFNNGQTIGKKILKIKVVNSDGTKLTLNEYLYRSMILNSVFCNILVIACLLFFSKNYYFYVSYSLQFIQIVLILITIFMVLFRNDGRGLHDMVAHSKVVEIE